jgi:zinc/manganese transport system substrate-binding protein
MERETGSSALWSEWRRPVAGALRRIARNGAVLGLIVLAAVLIGGGKGHAAAPPKPVAVTSISILADFVRAVGGDAIAVESIVPVGGDPHVYEPVPSDARKLARAAIVFRNGAGLERWMDRLIGTTSDRRPVVTLADGLTPIVQASGTYQGRPDPHMWMDPSLAARYVLRIRDVLAQRYPAHAAAFRRNAAAYLDELAALDAEIRGRVERIPPARRKLVTTHDAYRYFATRYGLELVASIWGISTEAEPSAAEVSRIVTAVRNAGVPTVFVETTVNPKLMQRIARDAGVRIGAPLYGDSVGGPGSGAETYLGMMRANASAIAAGLAGD